MAKVVATKDDPMLAIYEEDKGKGLSTAPEDNQIPLVYILQSGSPQINARKPEYLEGASSGMFWLRNNVNPLVKGEVGMIFQHCVFKKSWGEWVPRDAGGGFAGRHERLPADAVVKEGWEDMTFKRHCRPNGNDLVETHEHIGYVFLEDGRAMPYVLPMTSTLIPVSKSWMTTMNTMDKPVFRYKWLLRTRERNNKKGTWFTLSVNLAGETTDDEYMRGRALHEAFTKGALKAEAASVRDDDQEIPF